VNAQDGIRFLPSVAGEVLQGLDRHRLLTARQVQVLHLPGISPQLHLFLSASGLPVRVITSTRFARNYLTGEQVDLLSINSPVSIAAPPADQVIGWARAAEYEGFMPFGHTKPCPALTRGRRAPIGG
jgi:hypothetical protein